MASPKFTPTEQRILDLLSDGLSHRREEFLSCLYDELGRLGTVRLHLYNMRKKLRPIGQDIVTEMGQSRILYYRHVRLLHSPYRN